MHQLPLGNWVPWLIRFRMPGIISKHSQRQSSLSYEFWKTINVDLRGGGSSRLKNLNRGFSLYFDRRKIIDKRMASQTVRTKATRKKLAKKVDQSSEEMGIFMPLLIFNALLGISALPIAIWWWWFISSPKSLLMNMGAWDGSAPSAKQHGASERKSNIITVKRDNQRIKSDCSWNEGYVKLFDELMPTAIQAREWHPNPSHCVRRFENGDAPPPQSWHHCPCIIWWAE